MDKRHSKNWPWSLDHSIEISDVENAYIVCAKVVVYGDACMGLIETDFVTRGGHSTYYA